VAPYARARVTALGSLVSRLSAHRLHQRLKHPLENRYQMQYPQNKTTLVVEHVHPVGDTGKSVGMAKVAFADAVVARAAPF